MGLAEEIMNVLEFYSDASPQARLSDEGKRAFALIEKLADGDDATKLETVVSYAESAALQEPGIESSRVLEITQEFAE